MPGLFEDVPLKELIYLELDRNRLKTLPSGMNNLTNLFKILLQNNQLSSLPDDFYEISCIQLFIDDNPISNTSPFPNVKELFYQTHLCSDPINVSNTDAINRLYQILNEFEKFFTNKHI